jgi:hypothetical protein
MSGLLAGIVLSVIMLWFQYNLKLSFSSTLACVPIVWTFVYNQFSCFCQFLVENVCYSITYFCILGIIIIIIIIIIPIIIIVIVVVSILSDMN